MEAWNEVIIAAHIAVTEAVSHAENMESDRYFVWQEDGQESLSADNRNTQKAITGTTDLFTKQEFDPWKEEFEASLDASGRIFWKLNSIQYEPDTGFYHYEWVWEVLV